MAALMAPMPEEKHFAASPCSSRKFMDCGVKPEEYHEAMEQLITGAQGDACILTNPREASGQDIASILKQAL